MPRDALWVTPNGTTTVVTVDDEGNPIEPVTPAPEPPKEPPKEPPRKPGRPRKQT